MQDSVAHAAPDADRGARSARDRGGDRGELLHPLRGGRACESRLDGLIPILPGFVRLCRLRLLPVRPARRRSGASPRCPTCCNIVRAVDGAGGLAARARLRAGLAAVSTARIFFGKITIVLYWFLQMVFLARIAHRLSLFPLRAHAAACARGRCACRRWCSGAPPMPRCCCARSRAARSARSGRSASCRRRVADRGQSIRGIPVLGGLDDLEQVVRDARQRGTRVVAADLHAVRAGARGRAGSDPDAGAPARAARPAGCRRSTRAARRCGLRRSRSRTCCCGRA